MQKFTDFQYMMIAVANTAGKDKLTYNQRLEWVKANINDLDKVEADEPYLYSKAAKALDDVRFSKPTNNIVHFDAVCSGIQLLSAMTGCKKGAMATGLINTGKRPDAYTDVLGVMQATVGESFIVHRDDVKRAVMCAVYGSTAVPEEVFGVSPKLLGAFKKSTHTVAPGAFQMLEILRNTWQPMALEHRWILPDGFHANIKVLQKDSVRLEIDELDHHYVTAEFKVNAGSEKGLSNIAK